MITKEPKSFINWKRACPFTLKGGDFLIVHPSKPPINSGIHLYNGERCVGRTFDNLTAAKKKAEILLKKKMGRIDNN